MHVAIDGGNAVYWIERRPSEGGRSVLVKRGADGGISDVTPPGMNARTRFQEFENAPYAVRHGVAYCCEFSDQRIYRFVPGEAPEPLTPAGAWYYADPEIDPRRNRLIAVREDHTERNREPATTLVSVPLQPTSKRIEVVLSGHLSGHDFYATPRLSPDGSQLSYLAWRHPQMPWDGTELWVADVGADGVLSNHRHVAGGATESIFQPGWSPTGELHFVSDRTGWWNLYRCLNGQSVAVWAIDADCGRPQWVLGSNTWAFADPTRLVVSYTRDGRWHLVTIVCGDRPASDTVAPQLLTEWEPGEYFAAAPEQAVFIAGSPERSDAIVRVDLAKTPFQAERLREAAEDPPAADISVPASIRFRTDSNRTAHAFFYPAMFNRHGKPPLIVSCHGGPTTAASSRLNLEVQFWTSRGFGVADVNYGGSSGFGRAYRERLNGRWGIVDVEDCVNAALHLVNEGLADRDRLIIRGRSAGGFTALAALAFRPEIFKAAASYYGVADLELLAHDTHKFESRYLDRLVGSTPLRDRSPIHHVDRITCPVIFFQGLEDRVVPPAQSESMARTIAAKGLPVKLVTFPGESHGFRKAGTIARCLEEEFAFYRTVLGF